MLKHDLNAFVEERRRFIPTEFQFEFHRDMTSYDTEEAAFAKSLLDASALIEIERQKFFDALFGLARDHRFTLMLERTHGQGAELTSFGTRVGAWKRELFGSSATFDTALKLARYSRISGAVGNYGEISPELEEHALSLLKLDPFYGATQILPRTMYAPLAQSLQLMCHGLGKIALDIRLGARSGNPIMREPFKKTQMGSSAMPHKRNPITTEQMAGMVRLANGYAQAIVENCSTWEARAIEQSAVERVAWPDLFHVTIRMFSQMTRTIDGLVVYPDNMMREITEARGTYASSPAKNFLAAQLAKRGIEARVAYGIIQLASFNVFRPSKFCLQIREEGCTDLKGVDERLAEAWEDQDNSRGEISSIEYLIPEGELFVTKELAFTQAEVVEWNALLLDLFSNREVEDAWHELFNPSNLLPREAVLFEKMMLS